VRRALLLGALALALAGCKSLPDKPAPQTLYDFGPVPAAAAAGALPTAAALVLPEVEARGLLETPALLYRLGYDDPHQLRSYAYARWSAPPAQLLRQRLRDLLGRDRPILDSAAATALARRGGAAPPVLRIELEEFSQQFASPGASEGVLRLRASLMENTPGGERLIAQREFALRQPAPSADAAGGVRALAAATEAAAQDIAAWLQRP